MTTFSFFLAEVEVDVEDAGLKGRLYEGKHQAAQRELRQFEIEETFYSAKRYAVKPAAGRRGFAQDRRTPKKAPTSEGGRYNCRPIAERRRPEREPCLR